ncbi:hypothetical protein, unlikely [Trypanosoma brucei gambiense DAL972]|uniref:Uncharacterized protein n=1 Tax=Trypanosoma brucei gambiense (strain MHOM/CI/86/DAL972) TaxID=679716 RepID=C9ZSD3_TRYB9|nr:hypothetical protein, unlikely [Trypanosoma brucei gambiense DAL972]CBH12271.1 hypothetical protein, unlikely [Trypanosoma brucei gambiense DAL972]|eukprot:XP_011774552.1 hypothetical protein, unlikely [Trypanosoma brucei gambiense DAL972]
MRGDGTENVLSSSSCREREREKGRGIKVRKTLWRINGTSSPQTTPSLSALIACSDGPCDFFLCHISYRSPFVPFPYASPHTLSLFIYAYLPCSLSFISSTRRSLTCRKR